MINWSLTNAIQILALEFLATQGQVLLENKRFKRPVLEAWVRTQPSCLGRDYLATASQPLRK